MKASLMLQFYDDLLASLEGPLEIQLVPSRTANPWFERLIPKNSKLVRGDNAIERNSNSFPQKFLDREERLMQASHLFTAKKNFCRSADRVLLIDDVMSTGTSLISCVSLLLGLGYKEVYVLVLAYQRSFTGEYNGF